MDNHQLAREELEAIKVFNPNALDEICTRYFVSLKWAYKVWKQNH